MTTPQAVLEELNNHVGRKNGVTVRQLATKIFGGWSLDSQLREIRLAVQTLREQGHPICALPSCGYFIAAGPEDIEQTCNFLRARAMTSLAQVSQLNKQALPDVVGQIQMELSSREQPSS